MKNSAKYALGFFSSCAGIIATLCCVFLPLLGTMCKRTSLDGASEMLADDG